MRRLPTIIGIGLVVLFSNPLRCEVLGSWTQTGTSLRYTWQYLPELFPILQAGGIHDDMQDGFVYMAQYGWPVRWTESDDGSVLTVPPESPEFAQFILWMTNGWPEPVQMLVERYYPSGGYGTLFQWSRGFEQLAFSQLTNCDFWEANITAISVRLDNLDYNIEGSTLQIECTVTWLVEGSPLVPVEPTNWGRIKALYGS